MDYQAAMTMPDDTTLGDLDEMRTTVLAAMGDCDDISTDAHGYGWTDIENAADAAFRALDELKDEIAKREKESA